MKIWDPEHEMNLEGKLDWVEVMGLQSDSDGFYLGFETDYQGKLAVVFYPEPEMDLHLGGPRPRTTLEQLEAVELRRIVELELHS